MYGVVPAASALAGPSGYLGNGATRQQEDQEERTGLLRVSNVHEAGRAISSSLVSCAPDPAPPYCCTRPHISL
jgi:hypothetical protein